MIIGRAILHILDSDSDLTLMSQKELNLEQEDIQNYLHKHIDKFQSSDSVSEGKFRDDSDFRPLLQRYLVGEISFVDFSISVAERLFESIVDSEEVDSIDFLMADFRNEDHHYIGIMLLDRKEAFTHCAGRDGELVENSIIRHYAILPGLSQKISSCACIDCDDLSISITDKKRTIQGEQVMFLKDKVLMCTCQISAKDALKTIRKITSEIADENGENSATMVSKTKSFMLDNAETSSEFSPMEIGREVFAQSPLMRKEYEERIREHELPDEIPIEQQQAVKLNKNHKIKTDTGIEIVFPADYSNNTDYIEFINNPNGTISIQVKNIGKITNR